MSGGARAFLKTAGRVIHENNTAIAIAAGVFLILGGWVNAYVLHPEIGARIDAQRRGLLVGTDTLGVVRKVQYVTATESSGFGMAFKVVDGVYSHLGNGISTQLYTQVITDSASVILKGAHSVRLNSVALRERLDGGDDSLCITGECRPIFEHN